MDIGYSLFKGFVQGLTEFLPVSSTAHLIFSDALGRLFGIRGGTPLPGEEEFFDILLHMGTLLAVLVYFRQDIVYVLSVLAGKRPQFASSMNLDRFNAKQLPVLLAISMVCTVVVILGFLKGSEKIMEAAGWTTATISNLSDYYMEHPVWVAFHLIITGCLLFFTEWISHRHHRKHHAQREVFGLKNALWMGTFQGFAAIFHGISRSGSTISAGLLSGADRLTATRYSFMLSIPTFIMAAVYEGLKMHKMGHISHLNWPVMLAGTAVSAVVGYFCVKYFIQYVAKHSLAGFAYYCWATGAVMLLLLSRVS